MSLILFLFFRLHAHFLCFRRPFCCSRLTGSTTCIVHVSTATLKTDERLSSENALIGTVNSFIETESKILLAIMANRNTNQKKLYTISYQILLSITATKLYQNISDHLVAGNKTEADKAFKLESRGVNMMLAFFVWVTS